MFMVLANPGKLLPSLRISIALQEMNMTASIIGLPTFNSLRNVTE